ncbi:MAG: CDP-6-deoxy-delta-3,4-glucoseen reductase [Acidiferrobacteraceae bacterium]|jgi:CDP-4-dehydro-6-deoxyglucose reductase
MTYTIKNEASGTEFSADENESVLDAALRQGIVLPYSCHNGSCGTCKGRVVSGAVDYGQYDPAALSDAERADGLALFCQARPLSDLVIRAQELGAVANIPVKTLPARVVKMEKLAHDVMGLWLRLPANQRLQFLAGQYIDILLRGNEHRSFSLANAPADDEMLQLQIRLVPGGSYTGHVFEAMKEKDLLRFRGPLGTFFLRDEPALPAILVAGGTGFAPMKSILEQLFASGERRDVHLYWGARSLRDLYAADLARSWAQEYNFFRFTPVLSDPQPEDGWIGRTGWVHEAVIADHPDLSGTEVYASGPPPMIDALKAACLAHGLATDHLYYDSFEFAHGGE